MSLVAAPAGAQELIGFHPDRVDAQREMERRADDWIVADELLEWNRLMTPRPHHAGAPQTEANARWMVERSGNGDSRPGSRPSTCCSRRRGCGR